MSQRDGFVRMRVKQMVVATLAETGLNLSDDVIKSIIHKVYMSDLTELFTWTCDRCDGMTKVSKDLNATDSSSSPMATLDDEVVLRRYENFKKFDFAVDHSDHLFSAHRSAIQQPNWLNRIKLDRMILEEHLPDTIFMRAYESRMDLLRVVIIGLEGTPYQDGLFVFDLFFPENYPNSLPLMRYHSCGLSGINPVINNLAGVNLSVFKVSGRKKTYWVPSMNVLQLLVFTQNLILNTKPYYNGSIYANYRKSVFGEWSPYYKIEQDLV